MRILALSDIESSFIHDHFDPQYFKGVSLVLAAGDMRAEYLSYIVTMLNVPLLYVHGNHDARLLKEPPEGCTCIDGIIYEHDGLRIAGLGGCMTYTGGPLQYTEKEMTKRIAKNKFKYRKGIDLFLTHAPAFGLGDGTDQAHTGYKCFIELLDKYKPGHMVHGHQHLNYGKMERTLQYQNTKIINAYDYIIFEI